VSRQSDTASWPSKGASEGGAISKTDAMSDRSGGAGPGAPSSGPPSSSPPLGRRSRRKRIPEEAGVVLALVVLVVGIGVYNPDFLSLRSLAQLLSNAALTGILAIGMVFVIVIREIDLSIGWTFNFSAVIAATLMVAGVDPFLAAAAGILFGGVLGLINGLLTVGLGLPAIIITLGTLSAFRGLSLIVNNSRAVVPPDKEGLFFTMWSYRLFDVLPSVAIAFLLLAAAMHVVLQHSRFGYRAQALGSNPDAARLAGIPVQRTRLAVLILMGFVGGLAGVIFLGFRQAIDPTSGDALLLPVIAAVIIGGTPLSGGRGSIFGAVLGALIIQVVQNGILFLSIDPKWSIFVTGAVIVIAVAIDQVVRRQRSRRARDVVDAG
jgi:ribose transport system permease protein